MRRAQNPTMMAAEQAALVPLAKTPEAVQTREFAGMQFTLHQEELDATIINGRFPNKRISEIVVSVEGRDYLGGLWRTSSPELQAIIKHQFEL